MAQEKPDARWYVSGGRIGGRTTLLDPYTSFALDQPAPAPGTTIDLWVVARDGRGGADWLHRSLVVR
jgi:hypothetical protein